MVRKRSEDYRPMSVLPSIRSGQKAVTVHLKDSWTYARQQLFEKSQPVVEIPSFGKVYAVTKLRSVTAAVLYNVGLIDAQGMENIPPHCTRSGGGETHDRCSQSLISVVLVFNVLAKRL